MMVDRYQLMFGVRWGMLGDGAGLGAAGVVMLVRGAELGRKPPLAVFTWGCPEIVVFLFVNVALTLCDPTLH